MRMFSDIFGLVKAIFEDLGNLLDVYPKKRRFSQKNSDDDELSEWGPDSYEPWDFLSKEQWKEILEGKRPIEDYTMSHVWPPHLKEAEPIEDKQEDASAEDVEQENGQEQNEDSKNAESVENSEGPDDSSEINSVSNSDSEFETDAFEGDFDSDYSSGDYGSGNYEGYIG